ncbi:MAG: hypothetical protein K0R94_540 [Burkholderiales bacterium]|jgi:hypothetical protein|nr:hypothetical protein [Burkholderiales bacterium]
MICDLKISQDQLQKAVLMGIISHEQSVEIWRLLEQETISTPKFCFVHMLYYFGGLLSIGAVTFFIGLVWETFKGYGLFMISFWLFIIGLYATHILNRKKMIIPAGIMAAFSLVLVPLMIYNLQYALHLAPGQFAGYEKINSLVSAHWVPIEFATLIAGIILFYFYRFNFILLPVSVILWYLSMDLYPMIFKLKLFTFIDQSWFTMLFGLIQLLILIRLDYIMEAKHADKIFWLYLAATITFWGGLSALGWSYNHLGHFIYFLINILMLVVSIILQRRIFAIFAVIGIFGYLSYLSQNSLILPLILILTGFLIIYLATKWSNIENKFIQLYNRYLPRRFRGKLSL